MGTTAQAILGIDQKKVIDLLNKAYADEWLAYYQYWIGSKVLCGIMRVDIEKELQQHAEEELKHAGMLADRIIQLGGTPLLKPEEWYKNCNCRYLAPEDPDVHAILQQNIKGEQCAIRIYHKLLSLLKNKDEVTYDLILDILKDEIEHEEDLEMLKKDIESL